MYSLLIHHAFKIVLKKIIYNVKNTIHIYVTMRKLLTGYCRISSDRVNKRLRPIHMLLHYKNHAQHCHHLSEVNKSASDNANSLVTNYNSCTLLYVYNMVCLLTAVPSLTQPPSLPLHVNIQIIFTS